MSACAGGATIKPIPPPAGVLVAGHSVVDFSLQIPAESVVFAAMLGAACAQSRSANEPEPYLSRMRR